MRTKAHRRTQKQRLKFRSRKGKTRGHGKFIEMKLKHMAPNPTKRGKRKKT